MIYAKQNWIFRVSNQRPQNNIWPLISFYIDIVWQTDKFWQLLRLKISRFMIHSQAGIGSKGWKILSLVIIDIGDILCSSCQEKKGAGGYP
ncbi:MAG: hypothetical protein AVO38_08010 [delta proteobacterium ML8_D]|nr:MAG: hypothetical protein AVO38_08010 [delta proteobacterium ML8_D]